jgi:hypothetical protein
MANNLYNIWKEAIIQASTNSSLTSTNVRAAFIDSGVYSFNQAHDFYNDLSTGVWPNTRATGIQLGTKTYAAGVFDAADSLFAAFSNGSISLEGIIIYIDDGVADTSSRLVAFFDASITGIPFTPSGSDVTIQWNASGIFAL